MTQEAIEEAVPEIADSGAPEAWPHRIRALATSLWVAGPLITRGAPQWTRVERGAWRGLPAMALRYVDVLQTLGIDAEMESDSCC